MKKYFLGVFTGILLVAFAHFASAAIYPMLAADVFSDVEENAWYTSALTTMYSQDIVNGYPDGTFRPADSINRAEAVVLLDNARQRIHENMDELRFVICYGTSTEPNTELSEEDSSEYTRLKDKLCGQAQQTLLPGYSW